MSTTNYDAMVVNTFTLGGFSPPAADKKEELGLLAGGAITIKQGFVYLNDVAPIVATLADPTASTDDFKELTISDISGQAHTVSSATSFGGGGAGKVKATFGGAVGDTLKLIAYNGKWWVVNAYNVTLGVA